MAQRIAIIGAGSVGTALASGLSAAGHDVVIGVREPNRSRHEELPVAATNAVGAPIPGGFSTLGDFVGSMLPPEVGLVKAFNTIGAEHLTGGTHDHPTFLPIAGDETATPIAASLATDLGFEVAVLGGRETFGLVENHARLWIHLAIRRGWGRDFAWSVVRR